jgi:uncharacterized protein (TIGR00730 family)
MHDYVPSGPPRIPYRNSDFLDSDEGRPLRILAEYLEPHARFTRARVYETIVFFGSARITEHGPLSRYYEGARALAHRLTRYGLTLDDDRRYMVCTGGGGGIMEAANRGAAEAGGKSIGLNIGLPHEQRPNSYVPPELSLEFRYFFMRKLWFSHMARALVVFPGGFGTLDELTEILTLSQTGKLERKISVLLYGRAYWEEVVNFPALVRHGMIAPEDLSLFSYADDPDAAYEALLPHLPAPSASAAAPRIAKSRYSEDEPR